MSVLDPALTVGIEEEYLLIDPRTGDLVSDPDPAVTDSLERKMPGRISPEFMRCQIEVGTAVCPTIAEARADLAALRRGVADGAAEHGLAIIASATHPFATWRPQKTTGRDRYEKLARDIGVPVRRLLICGMHVHVGIEDENLRIDLMNQFRYFLPHLLALSTSSPFWQGEPTGLKSYRLAVFSELPRTGLPEEFQSWGEYARTLETLVATGAVEDGSKLWWDLRPSSRYPTLEMRICDVCTRLDDTITIAALYLCLMRMLWRYRRLNVSWRRYRNLLVNENRWRAMRYGFDEGLMDFGRGEVVPYADLLEEWLALVAEDADALGCTVEVNSARDILKRGTSAHRQVAVRQAALAAGASETEALKKVVDWLAEETIYGL